MSLEASVDNKSFTVFLSVFNRRNHPHQKSVVTLFAFHLIKLYCAINQIVTVSQKRSTAVGADSGRNCVSSTISAFSPSSVKEGGQTESCYIWSSIRVVGDRVMGKKA